MTLEFPNRSRSFDEERGAVRFIGYDGMFEVRFFVEAGALSPSHGASRDGAGLEERCLSAFDAIRSSILDAARKAYSGQRRGSYTLTVADLR